MIKGLVLSAALLGCVSVWAEDPPVQKKSDKAPAFPEEVAPEQREEILRGARIYKNGWTDEDIRKFPLLRGVEHKKFRADERGEVPHLEGEYEEFKEFDPNGLTAKFKVDIDGKSIKAKYGWKDAQGKPGNDELPSEVMGTRFLGALGFYTDDMWLVDLTVKAKDKQHGVPPYPWRTHNGIPRDRISPADEVRLPSVNFGYVAVERKVAGAEVLTQGVPDQKQGINLHEFDKTTAPKEQVDGLKMLAAFIQHVDNKTPQQRLTCPPDKIVEKDGKVTCTEAVAYIQDLGRSFGSRNTLKVAGQKIPGKTVGSNLAMWAAAPLWKDAASCVAYLPNIPNESDFKDPPISEEGRLFALSKLKVFFGEDGERVRELYRGAHLAQYRPEGTEDQFVATFKKKMDEMERKGQSKPCPSAAELRGGKNCATCGAATQPAPKTGGNGL
jgi:hypothetical protein